MVTFVVIVVCMGGSTSYRLCDRDWTEVEEAEREEREESGREGKDVGG